MCKVEKETWIKLDQLEEDCQKLITQVEKKAETLVSLKTHYSAGQSENCCPHSFNVIATRTLFSQSGIVKVGMMMLNCPITPILTSISKQN